MALPSSGSLPTAPVRWLLYAMAVVCIVLAMIGVLVPGMPSTVFVILAAWAAARSSPALHDRLLRNPLFGPLLREWQSGGCVSRRAKWSASIAMGACAVFVLGTVRNVWVASLAIGCMDGVLAWLWCRPEPPPAAPR
ncbi:YbaN family protein [Xylophilus ampelinus]|uniref:DUF454 domain-containing protein n=1 Tax=Xylophilus ampelinus TaxID=54067 RepID=A0A318SZV9_9BURK|nr:YbaN family protein [Xylophilus ampelinus]MCS4509771.1 YbaN family protein [Xylophilus ampelinus]PYE78701.1 hypothetical protein DFQ15_10560 [Xylophilus ampelinus]